MQRVAAVDVSSVEWRWVIILGGLLVAVTLLPYAWAFTANASASGGQQFMGILYNPLDGATYLAKIGQGMRGAWLFELAHTSEPHQGVFINAFYLALGHLAKVLGLSELLMFHIARLATGFMMFVALYHLGSTIWPRMRPRRLFFGILALGSGLGWLALMLDPGTKNLTIDLLIPEAIPLFATFVNPHFPLAIAIIALLASMYVVIFRPGFDTQPNVMNGGASIMLLSLLLSLIQPQGWLPLAGALCAYIALLTVRARRIPTSELSWVLLMILPALPVFFYYWLVTVGNPVMAVWNEQNVTLSPTPDRYLLGFGLPLLVAIPGIWRAMRHLERDGDRLMLVWLVVNAVLLYAPLNMQRRMVIGMFIPITYFAVRALEDFWFHLIRPKIRDAVLLVFFVFIIPSNVLAATLPIFGALNSAGGLEGGLLLPTGYVRAIDWLDRNVSAKRVVLAPSKPSLWIPSYTSLRVVYGHPFETLHADERLQEVQAWYSGQASAEECRSLVKRYSVSYIVAKSPEAADVEPGWPEACLQALDLHTPVAQFDDVSIYRVP